MTTTVTALPTPAPTRNDPSTFAARMDAVLSALSTWITQMNAAGAEVTASSLAAAASALLALTNANSAAATGGVTLWVSGTTYTQGNVVFAPSNLQTYRRKTNGAGTTDPASDATNWQAISINPNGAQLSAATVTGGLTVTGGVTASGAVAISGALSEKAIDMASGTNVDLNAGKVFKKTISGPTTLTVSNVPAAGLLGMAIMDLTNAGTNITWWAGLTWDGGGGPPTFSASGSDRAIVYTIDGGASWTGIVPGKAFA